MFCTDAKQGSDKFSSVLGMSFCLLVGFLKSRQYYHICRGGTLCLLERFRGYSTKLGVLRPFQATVYARCYRTVVQYVCPVCPECDVGVLWPNGWIDQDETCYECMPRPGHIVLDGDPVPPEKKGHSSPHFSAHVYCSQQMHGSRCRFVWS